MRIRQYEAKDEQGWVRCRVLAFLDTAYFDNVLREKEHYANPAIELVAEKDGGIVGLLDIELDRADAPVCSPGSGLGGMIWHLAVHPDEQGQGIGSALLEEAERLAREFQICRFQAWTRDDPRVNAWYIARGFEQKEAYLHVYAEGDECSHLLLGRKAGLYPVACFAHYVGEDWDRIKSMFQRVHECRMYEYQFDK